jgi:hypothetical protein
MEELRFAAVDGFHRLVMEALRLAAFCLASAIPMA